MLDKKTIFSSKTDTSLIDPLTHSEIPPVLYKYRDSENSDHLKIIENLELFFSSPKKFNDPFDCKIPVKYQMFADNPELAKAHVADFLNRNPDLFQGQNREEIINNVPNTHLVDRDWLIKHEQDTTNQLNDDIGVLCLSEEFDNILLWSHYGQCHRGFCLGIDFAKLVDSSDFATGGPVHYTNIYPVLSPFEDGLTNIYTQIFYKSLVWAYEKEYRLLKMRFANKTTAIKPDVIKSIYLGLSIDPAMKRKIIEISESNLPTTQIFQMVKSPGKFSVNAVPLP